MLQLKVGTSIFGSLISLVPVAGVGVSVILVILSLMVERSSLLDAAVITFREPGSELGISSWRVLLPHHHAYLWLFV